MTKVFGSPGQPRLITWFGYNGSPVKRVGFLEESNGGCDLFDGNWVWDESYPLYESEDCLFIDEGFRCSENGRRDKFYTKWRWQPKNCNLPRYTLISLYIYWFVCMFLFLNSQLTDLKLWFDEYEII